MRELKFGLFKKSSPYEDTDILKSSGRTKRHPTELAVLKRDFYCCQYCGFCSEKYQACIGVTTKSLDDCHTACIFCEQVLYVNLIPRQRSGILIWLPEVPQALINRTFPEIYAFRITQGPKATRARAILDKMVERRGQAKEKFGSDDPLALCNRLKNSVDNLNEIDAMAANGLRIMPRDRKIVREGDLEFNQFPQILAFWRSKMGPLSKIKLEASSHLENLENLLSTL